MSAKIINETDFELVFNINAGNKYFLVLDLLIPQDYSIESFNKIIETMNKLEGKYSLDQVKKILIKLMILL